MSDFSVAFNRFRKNAKATFLLRAISAVAFAALAVGLTQVAVEYVPRLSSVLPGFLFSGLNGTVYAYVIAFCFGTIVFRSFSNKLFSYEDISDGQCFFAVGCGAKADTFLTAKFFSGMFAAMETYVMGAAIVFAGEYILGANISDYLTAIKIMIAGLALLVVCNGLNMVLGALGIKKTLLSLCSLLIFFFAAAALYVKGFLAMRDDSRIMVAVENIAAPTGAFALAAVGILVLAAVLCLILPKKKISKYEVEDLDDEMLKNLKFDINLEVYEKMDDEYELLFAGNDVLND